MPLESSVSHQAMKGISFYTHDRSILDSLETFHALIIEVINVPIIGT